MVSTPLDPWGDARNINDPRQARAVSALTWECGPTLCLSGELPVAWLFSEKSEPGFSWTLAGRGVSVVRPSTSIGMVSHSVASGRTAGSPVGVSRCCCGRILYPAPQNAGEAWSSGEGGVGSAANIQGMCSWLVRPVSDQGVSLNGAGVVRHVDSSAHGISVGCVSGRHRSVAIVKTAAIELRHQKLCRGRPRAGGLMPPALRAKNMFFQDINCIGNKNPFMCFLGCVQ